LILSQVLLELFMELLELLLMLLALKRQLSEQAVTLSHGFVSFMNSLRVALDS